MSLYVSTFSLLTLVGHLDSILSCLCILHSCQTSLSECLVCNQMTTGHKINELVTANVPIDLSWSSYARVNISVVEIQLQQQPRIHNVDHVQLMFPIILQNITCRELLVFYLMVIMWEGFKPGHSRAMWNHVHMAS